MALQASVIQPLFNTISLSQIEGLLTSICIYLSILQIFQDGELTHYVDGTGDQSNWMKYVNCARHEGEQNLVLVQEDGELFYEVCKDVAEGSELLVWYGDSYLKYMGIPITMKTKLTKIENDGGIGMGFKLLNITFMYLGLNDSVLLKLFGVMGLSRMGLHKRVR